MALPKIEQENIKWALSALTARRTVAGSNASVPRATLFQTYLDYYEGRHPLLFATPAFLETFGTTFQAMVENLCPLPVDLLADLLQVTGFTPTNSDDPAIGDKTQEIWRRNRMDERAGWIHRDLLLYGETYVIVWPDEGNEAIIYPNLPSGVSVQYDDEKMGYIVKAAKFWTDNEGYGRLTIYTPQWLYRYRTKAKTQGTPMTHGVFIPYDTDTIKAQTANPYGKVPVFRFANNTGVGYDSHSELDPLIPGQDRLNKGLCDLLLASEYAAYPQKYALGYEFRKDADGKVINPFKSGVNRMWAFKDKDTKIGQLDQANLEQYMNMINDARLSFARLSGFPSHYISLGEGGWPSGESLKTASERQTRKAKDRMVSVGGVWADIMRFCLQVEGVADVQLETQFEDPAPRLSDKEIWETAILQQKALVSAKQTHLERGYSEEQAEEWETASLDALMQAREPLEEAA